MGTISEKLITIKEFFTDIKKRFVKNEKAEIYMYALDNPNFN